MTTVRFRPSREQLMINKEVIIEKALVKELIENVAAVFEITPKQMLGRGRYRTFVLARNMAFYILHTSYKQKASQIAPHFKKDRTTVLHGLNTFVNDIEVIPFYMEKYDKVMDNIFEPTSIYALQ